MRITVYDVLSYFAAGMTVAEILDDFPYLTSGEIQDCPADLLPNSIHVLSVGQVCVRSS